MPHLKTLLIIIFLLKVYGGGHFLSHGRLTINASDTVAVHSGGILEQNHSGYSTGTGPGQGTGHASGGSGGGYGGNGGRGVGTLLAGQTYGSLYTPHHFGSPGGFGKDYGKDLFYFPI